MTTLKLAQSFSLIALNAQRSLEMNTVKKVALRCIAAAVVLETFLDDGFTPVKDKLTLRSDALAKENVVTYQEAVFKSLLPKNEGEGDLRWWLTRATKLSSKKLSMLENTIVESLKDLHLIEEIHNLLGCDLYFDSAGVDIKEYRSDIQEYTRITEGIRAEILEDGPVTEETLCMLWLLRESGSMHDLFSRNELERVSVRMGELYQSSSMAKMLLPFGIHRWAELAFKQLLYLKKQAVRTQAGSGLNFIFPIIERSQAVFIETEGMFSSPTQRIKDVVARLESYGHVVNVLRGGQIPIMKIDNVFYEAIPQAVIVRVPIHGVRLLPKQPVV